MIKCFDLKKSAVAVCNCRKGACMKWFSYGFTAVFSMLLVVSLSGCGCGRKKKPDSVDAGSVTAPVSRMEDKGYREALDKHQEDQKVVARDRNELAAKMSVCAARVKAGLAADASLEDYKAALEKDEEWQALSKEQSAREQDIPAVLHEAQQTIRERLLKEKRDAAAATGG